jgi:hypothetical protein
LTIIKNAYAEATEDIGRRFGVVVDVFDSDQFRSASIDLAKLRSSARRRAAPLSSKTEAAWRGLIFLRIAPCDTAPRKCLATRIRTPTAATPLAPMPMPGLICRTGTGQRGTSIEPTTSRIDAGIDRGQPPTASISRALSALRRARPVV